MIFIVKLENGVWIADFGGPLGRTIVLGNAKVLKSEVAAKKALNKAREHRRFPKAEIMRVMEDEV